jgi:hypothetical protein
MKKMLAVLCMAGLLAALNGCAYLPGGTDLGKVANDVGMVNITTGDGTFENYTATGHYTGTEIGIAVGIPWLIKLVELYPVQSNEGLLEQIARSAKDDGANAMINVTPHTEAYTGIPFFIVGLYIDRTEGTGIRTR